MNARRTCAEKISSEEVRKDWKLFALNEDSSDLAKYSRVRYQSSFVGYYVLVGIRARLDVCKRHLACINYF